MDNTVHETNERGGRIMTPQKEKCIEIAREIFCQLKDKEISGEITDSDFDLILKYLKSRIRLSREEKEVKNEK